MNYKRSFFLKNFLLDRQDKIFFKNNLNRAEGLRNAIDVCRKNNINIDFNQSISEHYTIFSSLSKTTHKIKKILEIGTYDGINAFYLSKIFPNAHIDTIDLPDNNKSFANMYNRQRILKNFIFKRNSLVKNSKNVNFIQKNSLELYKENANNYDLIWIDGAHGNPVVTSDIINSVRLLKNNSIMLIDDVWKSRLINDKIYNSTAAFRVINELQKINIFSDVSFFYKRLDFYSNLKFPNNQKFIAFIKLQK